jgi:hypothetical protein
MTGHVFHPGHDELHGTTVIVTAKNGRTYVGRWHEKTPRGIAMRDVAIHDAGESAIPVDEWLGRQRRFGVAASDPRLIIREDEVVRVEPLDP